MAQSRIASTMHPSRLSDLTHAITSFYLSHYILFHTLSTLKVICAYLSCAAGRDSEETAVLARFRLHRLQKRPFLI